MKFNHELLKKDLKEKQDEEGKFSKQVCKEIGISKSARDNVMNEMDISLRTFTKCLQWLGQEPGRYLTIK